MRKVAKLIGLGFIALLLAPAILFAGYDAIKFQPRIAEVRALMGTAEGINPPSPQLEQFVRLTYRGHLTGSVARLLIWKLKIPYVGRGAAGWHVTYALWDGLVWLHIPAQEQVALVSALAYVGNGRFGFETEAQERFGKPFAALSRTELATIVALVHSPSLYQRQPTRLEKRRDWLLKSTEENGT